MSDIRIGLVGATGAVGDTLLEVLNAAPWSPDRIVPYASAGTTKSHVRYGDRDIAVDDLADADWGALDAVVLALPPEQALATGRLALDEGVPVVDCSGALAAAEAEVPLAVPWINPQRLAQVVEVGAASLPDPAALLLASVQAPLYRSGFEVPVDATLMLPASRWGRKGMEELSNQVVSMFNGSTPSRRVFEEGLAFDVLPAIGGLGADGWTDRERSVEAEVSGLVGADAARCTLTAVPVFSGVSAALAWPGRAVPSVELFTRVLGDGGVEVVGADPRKLPRPRRVEGRPFAQVGRLRLDASGQLHAWVALDNLRATATAATGLLGVLLKDRGYVS